MKFRPTVALGVFAVVSVLSVAVAPASANGAPWGWFGGQGGDGPGQGPPRNCHCIAESASCIFGEAGGCSVECRQPFRCKCKGASCPFGFPSSAICQCISTGA